MIVCVKRQHALSYYILLSLLLFVCSSLSFTAFSVCFTADGFFFLTSPTAHFLDMALCPKNSMFHVFDDL